MLSKAMPDVDVLAAPEAGMGDLLAAVPMWLTCTAAAVSPVQDPAEQRPQC